MKKTLAVVLAVVMLFATFAFGFAAFADDTSTCPSCGKPHSAAPGSCSCCLNCPNLDLSKVCACAKNENGLKGSFCCANCTGFFDCTCGKTCHCPFCSGDGVAPESELKPIVPEQTQIHIKDLFQNIIKKISEVFDRIFEAAFAVLNIK